MWHTLIANLNKRESYIEINGSYDRFYKYFINLDDNINLGDITAIPQERLTKKDLLTLDYLDEIRMPNLPIFSKKFVDLMECELNGIMTFHSCDIILQDAIFNFYIGRILNIIPMVDYKKSGFILLTDGSKMLDEPIFIRNDVEEEIMVARDCNNETNYFVSDKFKELVEHHKLNIGFIKSTDSFWD